MADTILVFSSCCDNQVFEVNILDVVNSTPNPINVIKTYYLSGKTDTGAIIQDCFSILYSASTLDPGIKDYNSVELLEEFDDCVSCLIVHPCSVSPTPSETSTPTPTPTPTTTPTLTQTPTETSTPTPTTTPTLTQTPTETLTPTPSVTPDASPSVTPTETPTNTPTLTQTPTQTLTPTSSVTPDASPSVTPTETPTSTPTPTQTPPPIEGDCTLPNCDPTYEWFQYTGDCCYRFDEVPSIPPSLPITLGPHTSLQFSQFGALFYDFGYNLDGTGTVVASSILYDIWSNLGPFGYDLNGPMNRCSLWLDPFEMSGLTWFGFNVCLSGITVEKTYYVGIAADNVYRLVLDGVEIVNSTPTGYINTQFKYWHVYPISLSVGDHILELYGQNDGFTDAGFGCEIYDNTLSELTAATNYNQLNVIFTSSGQTEATIVQDIDGFYLSNGFFCPSGYTYSSCREACISRVLCCAEPVECSASTLCVDLRFTSLSGYSDVYINTGLFYNNYNYYTGQTTGFFVFYSLESMSWCLSETLGGECVLFGRTNCVSPCPDLDESYMSFGVCITPTPTPVDVCSLDFEVIFNCPIVPESPTPTPTPTLTPTLTPSPTSLCYGFVDAIVNFVSPTPSVTPSNTPNFPENDPCRNISGEALFEMLNGYIICTGQQHIWANCRNLSRTYITSSSPTFGSTTIQVGQIMMASVDGISRCITYLGPTNNAGNQNSITLTMGPYVDCDACLPQPSPTATVTKTPTPTVTQTVTPSVSSRLESQTIYVYKRCDTDEYFIQTTMLKPNSAQLLPGQSFGVQFCDPLSPNGPWCLYTSGGVPVIKCFEYLGTVTFTGSFTVFGANQAAFNAGIMPLLGPGISIPYYGPNYFTQVPITNPNSPSYTPGPNYTVFDETYYLKNDATLTPFVSCTECRQKYP